jgi:hypothetical protein
MKPRRLLSLSLLAVVLTASATWAQGPCPEPGARTSWRVEYLTDDVKVPKLATREDVHTETQLFHELQEHKTTHSCVENVLRPRYILRDCIEHTFKPEAVVDPVTGCKRYVLKPVTEVRQVRTVVYDLCPEEKAYTVTTYSLKPVEKQVLVKRLVPECKTEDRKITRGVLIPSICVDRDVQVSPPCDPKERPLRPEDVLPKKP